jgi:hypothetical protein
VANIAYASCPAPFASRWALCKYFGPSICHLYLVGDNASECSRSTLMCHLDEDFIAPQAERYAGLCACQVHHHTALTL